MMLLGDGRVGLIREFPGSVALVQADGTPAGKFEVSGEGGAFNSLTGCAAAGNVMLISGTLMSESDRPGVRNRLNFCARIGDDGALGTRYATNATIYDFNDFRFTEREHVPSFWWAYAVAPDGTVCCVPSRDEYRIEVFGPDGTPVRTITRAFTPLKRTDQEYAAMHRMIESALNNVPFAVTIEVEKSLPVIAAMQRGLQLHDDGSLWVLTNAGARPGAPGVMATFDVFASDGRFVRQVALKAPHDGRRVEIFLAGSERILVVKGYLESLAAQFGNGATFAAEGEEPEAPEVICYEIAR